MLFSVYRQGDLRHRALPLFVSTPGRSVVMPRVPVKRWPISLRPDGGSLDTHAIGANGQIQHQRRRLARVRRERFGPDPDHTVSQSAVERAHSLPLQAVFRVAVRMALRDPAPAQPLAGPLLMALGARQIELSHALVEQGRAFRPERLARLDGE